MNLSWKPGREFGKKPLPSVIIHSGPSTPSVERATPSYDPLAAYDFGPRVEPKRKRGRPRKS